MNSKILLSVFAIFVVILSIECKVRWQLTSNGLIPSNAVEAGTDNEHNNEPLYIGRMKIGDGNIPGKVYAMGLLVVLTYSKEILNTTNYEILVDDS